MNGINFAEGTLAHHLLAVVAIGRNEGNRLHACLGSAQSAGLATVVVYVDSGSTDGSADYARAQGCEVVDLDMSTPFTAARARNEGMARALQCVPNIAYVQFLDGDCELEPTWMPAAIAYLQANTQHAVVCGRRRERYPDKSIYNQMCDVEWDTPVGDAKSCGGDAMMRVQALKCVGGYNNSLIAGEEPELCLRLRRSGWRVYRMPREMTLHDAAMLHFAQWWKRSKRAGHAFAEGAWMHGAPPELHWVAETRRALMWGLLLPLATGLLSVLWSPAWAALLLAYPLQVLRISRQGSGISRAFFLVLGKLPEMTGVLSFWLGRITRRQIKIIEYK